MATEHGFLIIADISGYTEFSIQSEIDHAEGIMKGLIGAILEAMKAPYRLSKLEGDAVFSYIPSNSFSQNQSLLESLDNVYFSFKDMLFQMQKNTNCPCNACINMRNLDLKIIMHYGKYAITEIAGGTELAGPDVILIHRLLKNKIRDKTDIDAYCFFTERSAKAMRLEEPPGAMIAHQEDLDQIGPIKGYVYSLQQAWEKFKAQRVIRVDSEDPYLTISDVIPLPPAVTWDYMNEDEHWVVWSQADEWKLQRPASGRNGVGLEKHCVHGKDTIVHNIVDWRPFEYYTTDLVVNGQVHFRHSVVLEPADGSTRVSYFVEPPYGRNWLPKLIVKLMGWKIRTQIETGCQSCLTTLREMVEADLAAGRILPRE